MTPHQTTNFSGFATQLGLGLPALALVTLALFALHADPAPGAFAYLVVIVLLALMGSFAASALLSIAAVAALNYFFTPPVFEFRLDTAQDAVLLAAFFATSVIVTRLMKNARAHETATLETAARLRRTEAELRDSERDWREIFEHNPVMYFMVDANGTVVNLNTFGATQLGYSPVELTGQSVLNVFLAEDRQFVRKCLAVCLKTVGKSHTWEVRKVRKDGSLLWVRENAKAMPRADDKLVILIACEDITERRQTENALRQSEAYLERAQELSRTGSFGWSPATGEIAWTKETFRIFQFDPATKPTIALLIDRIHPEDRAAVQRTVDQATCGAADSFDYEYRLALPDGSVKHVHSRAHATRNAQGRIEFVGAITDVTAAHEAELSLRRSEAYLAEAQRLSHTSSWAWDMDRGDFTHTSAELYRLFGFEPDDPAATTPAIQARVVPEDFRKLSEMLRRAMREKIMRLDFNFRINLPDGTIKHVHSVADAVLDRTGEIVEFVGTHMDVTEQHNARERLEAAVTALRESEQRFRDYAETASDWLWETGPDHRVTRLSEHTQAADIPASGVVGLFRWDIASDLESEPQKWQQHRAMLDAHVPFRDLEYRTVNREGAPIYVRTSGKPFFDASGKFMGYRGVSTDVTAMIRAEQAEQALRRARAELAHVTRVTMLGELTASIAHEINQPLAAILANADACLSWLDRTPADLGAARRSVEWIVDDGNRASEVIRRIRALARKTDIEKVPLDINAVVREAMALVARELASQDVVLRMELAPTLPPIFGDRVQLQQVIINLVMNGIEAMHAIEDRPRELLIRSGRDTAPSVVVMVTDGGIGIPDHDAERLFNPFFTTKSSGLGMGLSICRSIVEAHGGRLSVCRNESVGTTFRFTLPLHQEETS
jgi:PAS domain S-box-containing protein